MNVILCGIDWASDHHDVALIDGEGNKLGRRRIGDDATGLGELIALFAAHDAGPESVKIAIETERGLLVASLRAAGYQVYAINPKAVDRYRDRHHLAKTKSDAADAMVLAHILRTDAAMHRPLSADSAKAQAIEVLARAHQDMVWSRQHEVNRLRSLLGSYHPAALAAFGDLTTHTATLVLAAAPTPAHAAALSIDDLLGLLVAAGRGRRRGEAERLATVFAAEQMRHSAEVEQAMGAAAGAILGTITAMNTGITAPQQQMDRNFEQHPDAAIYHSMPALGPILSARVLGEFGDNPTRRPDPASRRAYAGSAPITRESGKKRLVLARFIRNKRLYDAVRCWAFSALTASPGARAYYDQRRAAGDTHEAALRHLASKLIGQPHHCLTHHVLRRADRLDPPRNPRKSDSSHSRLTWHNRGVSKAGGSHLNRSRRVPSCNGSRSSTLTTPS
jgi:transposase